MLLQLQLFFLCLGPEPLAVHSSGPPWGQWFGEPRADTRIMCGWLVGGSACSIVYRASPKNVSPKTLTERADRFNTHLKERYSEYFYLLFWNHGRLGPYTVRDGTHLTDDGNWKFYLSIRRATLTALSVLQMQEETNLGLALYQPKKTLFWCQSNFWLKLTYAQKLFISIKVFFIS